MYLEVDDTIEFGCIRLLHQAVMREKMKAYQLDLVETYSDWYGSVLRRMFFRILNGR